MQAQLWEEITDISVPGRAAGPNRRSGASPRGIDWGYDRPADITVNGLECWPCHNIKGG